jgi:ligand-binding sensor domain-containing protein/signal transduction histidine kinase
MSQYVRDRWETGAGFPRGAVYAITQTADGYLWIGTETGLLRFDGLTFQSMQSGLTAMPSISHVLGLCPDPDGSLWVRLRRPTLLRYRSGQFEDMTGQSDQPLSTMSAMAPAHGGGVLLWVLKGEPSAVVLRNGTIETLASPSGFSRSPVLAIAQTPNGDIWVGTRDSGLYRISGGRTSAILEGLPDLKVNALAATSGNEVWVGTDSGVVRWDGSRLTNSGVSASLGRVQALALSVDRDSNLWVGTNSRGLLRVNAGGVSSFEQSASMGAVTAVFEDREGNLWVGGGRGLERLRDSPFVTYSTSEGLPADGATPLYVDSEERVWLHSASGGLWWFKQKRKGLITNDGLDKDVIYSLDGGGNDLWIGRQRGGLTNLRSAGGSVASTTYTRDDGLVQNSVYSVYRARDGSVWAGTLSGGVSHLRGGRFTTYTMADGLASNTISSILEASDGAMWFGTPSGLSVLRNGRWQSYGSAEALPSPDINCLLEDRSGVLWVGTSSGLAYRDSGGFKIPSGLRASLREQIFGLAEDQSGAIWIAGANHVLRLNRQRLLDGWLSEQDIREFGLADGLRSVEGIRRQRSLVTDTKGRIWFSLNRGISVVDPARLERNSAPAIAHVSAMLADGKVVDSTQPVHVSGGGRRITLTYGGLSLSIPERVRFRYRLEGFDSGWGEPVSTREAVYTNLLPGLYRFRVMAANPDGLWNNTEASLSFVIDPLFYQTWWFQAGLVGGCLLSGLGLYRLRLRQVTGQLRLRFEERLAERTRIAQELHDTLLQGFLSASMQVHVATDRLAGNSQEKVILTRALELMAQVIEEGRNAVRGLRSSGSGSLDLEVAFSRIGQEIPQSESHPIAFRVIVEGEPRPLQHLLRDEVYRIGREAVVNAFRHAAARKIDLELKYSPNNLRMVVRDDGRGIDPEIVKTGRDGHWGLAGMRERADRIHASFHVWSKTGGGTEVDLSVPAHIAFQDSRERKLGRILRTFKSRHADYGHNDKPADSNTQRG